jgi:transposase
MKSISEFENFYLHRAPTDMRKSINGLAGLVEAEMKLDLKSSSLFIFCNKPRTRMKILYFDRSGFALWLKWLDQSKFPWPKDVDEETIVITKEDLAMLLDGVNFFTRFKEVHFETVL